MRSLVFPAVIVFSAAAHVTAGALLESRAESPPRAPARVEISIAPKPEPPPPPPVKTAPLPPAVARAAPHPSRPAPRVAAPRPQPTAAAAAPPAPADLTGVTLTNDTGWVTATGDGGPSSEVVTVPHAQPAAHAEPAPRPAVTALRDVSRVPGAPNLDDALRASYPRDARLQGTAGTAIVRARIGADGAAHVLGIVHESSPGFGDACRHTLAGSRWQPALDKRGTAVTTEITYTCRFEVGG